MTTLNDQLFRVTRECCFIQIGIETRKPPQKPIVHSSIRIPFL